MSPRFLPLTTLLAIAWALLAASPAAAAETHVFQNTFDAGQAVGHSPVGLAVDNSSGPSEGDIYVTDGSVVNKFTSASAATADETPDAQLSAPGLEYAYGIAVDPADGDVYVTNVESGTVFKFDAAGSQQPFSIEGVTVGVAGGVAVNPANGNVFVGDFTTDDVYELTSSGEYTGNTYVGTGAPVGLAVNSSGRLFVSQGQVIAFDTGTCTGACTEFSIFDESTSIDGVGIDPSNSDVYVSEGRQVTQFDESGNERGTFGASADLGEIYGVAIDKTSGEVYVADNANDEAFRFGPTVAEQILKVKGTGPGAVTSSPPGVECTEALCEAEFEPGSMITLTAVRAIHGKFVAWTGCEEEPSPTECAVEVTTAAEVDAEFVPIPQANLEVEVSGSGEVTSSPAGITCNTGTCTEHFDAEGSESTVTLTATAAADDHFVKWSGPGAGSCHFAPTCEVVMSASRTLKAEFLPNLRSLTVTRSGSGSVESSPAGIDCGEGGEDLCEAEFAEGSTVTLTATPPGHSHVTWSGCEPSLNPEVCEIEIGGSSSAVEPVFSLDKHELLVTPAGPGSISASPGPISHCTTSGGVCSGEYSETSTATLVATPAAHYHVNGWTGGCRSEPSVSECVVEIGAAGAEVGMSFSANLHTLTVSSAGVGSVDADSGSIRHCSDEGGICAGQYIEGGYLTLTATPGPHQMVAWKGCSHPEGDTCDVEIGASDLEVDSTFVPITHALTLTEAGLGQGAVSCDGGPCAAFYPDGTTLTLAANPSAGSTFAGWSGAGCSGTGVCIAAIDADTSLTATFNAIPHAEGAKPPALSCGKGFADKRGKCVRKPKAKRRHQPKRHHHRRGGKK